MASGKKKYSTGYAAKSAGRGKFVESLTVKGFNLYLVPLAFLVSLFPLIVRLYLYDSGLNNEVYYYTEVDEADFFLYYKAMAFIISSVLMAGVLIARLFYEGKRIRFDRIFIPLGVYAVLSFLSAVTSKNSTYAFTGIYEQFESVWVLIGYSITAYYAYLVIREVSDVKTIYRFLALGAVLMLMIGIPQYFGLDFYTTELGAWFIVPRIQRIYNGKPTFSFPAGTVYASLYNPNYVGTYVALLMPVFCMTALARGDKKIEVFRRILCIVILGGLCLMLLGSASLTGMVGVVAAVGMMCIISLRRFFSKPFIAIVTIIVVVGSLYTFNNYTEGRYLNELKQSLDMEPDTHMIGRMVTTDDDVTLTYGGETLHIRYNCDLVNGIVEFEMGNDEGYLYSYDVTSDGVATYTMVEGPLTGTTVVIPVLLSESEAEVPVYGMSIDFDGHKWYFTNQTDGTYYQCSYPGKYSKLTDVEKNEWMDEHGSFGSHRGYIWSRTLPLLWDNVILGSGPDTFVFEFPNDDFVGRHNALFDDQIITKPHNMYLQTAVQTGCLSLICLLVFYAVYFIRSFALYFKIKQHTLVSRMGVGILCGSFGYMVAGIANDSTLCITPVFWVLMGAGLAINELVKRETATL